LLLVLLIDYGFMFLCVNRNGKEKEHSNFTLQSQAAGDFLDQTNMLFNNGSS